MDSGDYQHYLPMAFPFKTRVHRDTAQQAALLLNSSLEMDNGTVPPNGSSFAVTSDTDLEDYRWLWMSYASLNRLREKGIIVNYTDESYASVPFGKEYGT